MAKVIIRTREWFKVFYLFRNESITYKTNFKIIESLYKTSKNEVGGGSIRRGRERGESNSRRLNDGRLTDSLLQKGFWTARMYISRSIAYASIAFCSSWGSTYPIDPIELGISHAWTGPETSIRSDEDRPGTARWSTSAFWIHWNPELEASLEPKKWNICFIERSILKSMFNELIFKMVKKIDVVKSAKLSARKHRWRWELYVVNCYSLKRTYMVGMIQETSYFRTKTNILRFEYWVHPDITLFWFIFS